MAVGQSFILLFHSSAGPILDELDADIKKFCETNRASLKPIENPMNGVKGVSKFGDTYFRCEVMRLCI